MSTSDLYTLWNNIPDSQLNEENIQKSLIPIPDDLWVAAACADRLVDNVSTQRALLDLGIQRTQSAVERSKEASEFPSSPKDERGTHEEDSDVATKWHDSVVARFRAVPTDAQLCNIRAVLLQRLDRLNTYVEVCKVLPEVVEDAAEEDVEDWDDDDPWVDGTLESPSTTTTRDAKSIAAPPISLPDFLTDDLLRIACILATQECFGAVRVLFERHATYLWPFRLVVLDSIPEHSLPSEYRDILPSFDPSLNTEQRPPTNSWRSSLDWSEMPEVVAAVDASGITFTISFASDIISKISPAHPDSLTAAELTTWYKNRVDHVISATGMIDIALATIQHGASQGIPDLDQLGEELSLLARLVYDAPQDDADIDDDWTLDRWNTMEPSEVVRAYLAHSTPETLPKDISRLVMPYLFVLESRAERAGSPDPSLPTRLFHDYILTAPLRMAAAVFEASKPTLPAAQRLIRDDEDIARLALACLYGSNSLDEWSTMSRIFECLPAWDLAREDQNDEDAADTTIASLGAFVTPSTSNPHCTASDLLVFFTPLPLTSLSRALDILDIHLESGEILARWSVPAPLRWFLQSSNDIAEQRAWANRMARRAGGSEDELNTQEDWVWLLEDMLKLCSKGETGLPGAFGLLPRKEVIRIFFGGLLSSGKFNIAKELLYSTKNKLILDSEDIEEICLASSREFYDNASSGNYKFGEMRLAYECLDVPPPSDRLLQEKEFIEATSRLSSFNIMSRPGIPISPIEIRLTKDRLSLVSQVLSNSSNSYKHTEVILDLVYKLGFRHDIAAEVKTLAMLADTALQAEDFTRAYETSERMVDTVLKLRSSSPLQLDDPKVQEASEVCWVACFQLGRQPEFEDVDKKLSLLGRALELCPPDKIHDVLLAWRRLEKEDIDDRQTRLSHRRSGTAAAAASSPRKRPTTAQSHTGYSLRARLQDFHMPSPPMLNTPDAAALASRTFRTVAANFPFSVGGRARSQASQEDGSSRSRSRQRGEVEDVATRVLSKGIGWLIGADDDV